MYSSSVDGMSRTFRCHQLLLFAVANVSLQAQTLTQNVQILFSLIMIFSTFFMWRFIFNNHFYSSISQKTQCRPMWRYLCILFECYSSSQIHFYYPDKNGSKNHLTSHDKKIGQTLTVKKKKRIYSIPKKGRPLHSKK